MMGTAIHIGRHGMKTLQLLIQTKKMNAKPFIKWAGGKGQLLSQFDNYLPKQLDGRAFTYIEPFVGGGAMLFYMLQARHIS